MSAIVCGHSFKCWSIAPSSPLHWQPSFLCMQSTCSCFRERFKPLFWNTSKLSSLHVGQELLLACSRWIHVWQKLVPQQVIRYGSRSIRWHIGHSIWKALGSASMSSQSYPPNILFFVVDFSCGWPICNPPWCAGCGSYSSVQIVTILNIHINELLESLAGCKYVHHLLKDQDADSLATSTAFYGTVCWLL